jgi:hypothetical protein
MKLKVTFKVDGVLWLLHSDCLLGVVFLQNSGYFCFFTVLFCNGTFGQRKSVSEITITGLASLAEAQVQGQWPADFAPSFPWQSLTGLQAPSRSLGGMV